ncbi:hypothetical protein FRC12_002543 [Ceratobasidium sp. 428]|nr:hypothetical protein FRC12_002543 [Ceratobasidium sp. 428]
MELHEAAIAQFSYDGNSVQRLQIAVACVKKVTTGVPKQLLRAITRTIGQIENRDDCYGLEILWCPAHSDIAGNTLANLEAKAATRGKQYPADLVPKVLINYPPVITRAVAKTMSKETNRSFALGNWRDSIHGISTLAASSTTSDTFLDHTPPSYFA